MKTVRYWIYFAVCSVLFLFLLSACGRTQDSPAMETGESASGAQAQADGTEGSPEESLPDTGAENAVVYDGEADRLYFLNGNDISPNADGDLFRVQSDCIVVRSNGSYGMIDTGLDGFEGVEERLTEQLRALAEENGGQISLDFLVITHAHMDHGGYFAELFEQNPYITLSDTCRIFIKPYEDNNPSYSDPEAEPLYNNAQVYEEIMEVLTQRFGADLSSHLWQEDPGPWQLGDFTLSFYNTALEAAESGRLNDNSIVTLVAHSNGATALLMGDCELSAEDNLLAGELAGLGDVDILKAGHHGMGTSSGITFLEQMNPQTVIATGIEGMYGQGYGGSLAAKCRQLGASLYSTYQNAQGVTVDFSAGEGEYQVYNGPACAEAAVSCPLESGWIELEDGLRIFVDDSLLKTEEEIRSVQAETAASGGGSQEETLASVTGEGRFVGGAGEPDPRAAGIHSLLYGLLLSIPRHPYAGGSFLLFCRRRLYAGHRQ